MSRIDAIVATQVGDTSRPSQTAVDRRLQVQQAAQAQTTSPATTDVRADDLRAIAAQMKQVIEVASGKRLSFKVSPDKEHTLVVEVSDTHTGELIRQIPSEEMLKLHERLADMVGVVIDRTA